MSQGDLPLVIQVLQEAIAISRSTGDKLILGSDYATEPGFEGLEA